VIGELQLRGPKLYVLILSHLDREIRGRRPDVRRTKGRYELTGLE
jgi:hypothetical protein